MSLLSKLNRLCWAPLKRAVLHIAVTCAALVVIVVVLALTGPGAADASGARPVARAAHHSHSESGRHKPARGVRHKPSCPHASHCKRAAAGPSRTRHAPAGGHSSGEESAAAEAASEEEEALESELAEEGSSEEATSGGSSIEAN
jgi:hypothetical protein